MVHHTLHVRVSRPKLDRGESQLSHCKLGSLTLYIDVSTSAKKDVISPYLKYASSDKNLGQPFILQPAS